MSRIRTACENCSKIFSAPLSAKDKTLRCPACKNEFVVQPLSSSGTRSPSSPPEPTKSTSAKNSKAGERKKSGVRKPAGRKRTGESKKQKFERLKTSLQSSFKADKIQRKPAGVVYLLGMGLVALGMMLLPVVYLLLIVAAGYGVVWHAVSNTAILTTPGGGFYGMIFKVLLYLAPIFGGVFMVLFMIKPILARPVYKYHRRFITRQSEPVIFWLVDQICQSLRCPVPRRIYVNCDVNASASYRPGFFSFLMGSEFALTFGMPLVACLNIQQFAGILAHEFGHFSQRSGMRLSFVIRSINAWFYRVATQRDSWDQWLAESIESEDGHWTIDLLLMFAMLCVSLSRAILYLFLLVSHGMSCFLMRQMEYSADTFEIRLCGSSNFKTTSHKLQQTGQAFGEVMQSVVTGLHQNKTIRSIPESLASRMSPIPGTGHVPEQPTGLFDSHPSDSSRIRKAEKLNAEGIFFDTRPASDIFLDFGELCRKVTEDFYRVNLGVAVGKKVRGRAQKDWMVE